MNINEIDTAADMIIRAYALTIDSSRTAINDAIRAYCDNPDTTHMTRTRIRIRIEDELATMGEDGGDIDR
jgi:hypothetical protein